MYLIFFLISLQFSRCSITLENKVAVDISTRSRGAARDFGPHEKNETQCHYFFCIIISSSLGASLGPPPSWAPRIRLLYPPFSAPLPVGILYLRDNTIVNNDMPCGISCGITCAYCCCVGLHGRSNYVDFVFH